MPQFLPAIFPATPNKDKPSMVTAGAMVRGVMNRKIKPIIPLKTHLFNNLIEF